MNVLFFVSVNNRAVLVGTSQSPSRGTVSVIQGDRWYSVCDQGWSAEDARVVCRSMGHWYKTFIKTI